MELKFDRNFEPHYGALVAVAPGVRRMTAPNASPFTFRGTNSFVVGEGRVAVIDPGPADEGHVAALLEALAGETVTHILVTHTHRDHSPGARLLQAKTGAPTYGAGPHRLARPPHEGEGTRLDAGGDTEFVPDHIVADGAAIACEGFALGAVATPGHTSNHLCFALAGSDVLFSGDHVMGWSTTVVAPPDGAMADYMDSLDRLLARSDRLFLPAHGGAIEQPQAQLRGLRTHRRMRERAILDRLAKGDRSVAELVAANYRDLDPALVPAAALSTLAHLEELTARGLVVADGPPTLAAAYRLSSD